MIGNGTDQTQEHITIRSRLSDIGPLSVWLDGLALRYEIPKNTQFAMNLCLEEALSNIIRHGYAGDDDRYIQLRFEKPSRLNFTFTVDDDAPQFNPMDVPEQPAINLQGEIPVGGLGIRLLREFADAVEYEPTDRGNRLRIRFSAVDSQP